MAKLFHYLMGAGYGAALMYFLDPQKGRERQNKLRDALAGYRDEMEVIVQSGMKDISNKTRGLVAETSARFNRESPGDWVLSERVRTRLGLLPARTRGVNVTAQNGTIYLEGDILREDLDKVLKSMNTMRGIAGVENRLRVHDEPGTIQSLQQTLQDQEGQMRWSPATRLLAGLGSLYLLMRGRRRGLLSPVFTLGGLALGTQVMTNKNLRQITGMQAGKQFAIHVIKTINVRAPVEEVYRMWQSFPNFSRFMSHIREITDHGGGRSHWVVEGPAGVPVEFDTMIIEDVPNDVIAWETLPGSMVMHSGRVRFRESQNGTQVNVRMAYTPPAGIVGHTVAAFFGSDPKSAMDQDLVRFKSLMETGETRAEGQKVRQEDLMRG